MAETRPPAAPAHPELGSNAIAIISRKWHINVVRLQDLLTAVGPQPVFETGLLLAGDVDPSDVRRQLSRWVRAGVLVQLRRGLYSLAPPYQKTRPHPFDLANRLVPGSYVSLQSALAHHGHIPEDVPMVTSVTLGRPGRRDTPLGSHQYHHLARDVFGGYELVALGAGHSAFVAVPEKALLDLVHLVPRGDDPDFLEGLRLQRLHALDLDSLAKSGIVARRPRLRRALRRLGDLAAREEALAG